jgi:hypothetical protein
MMCHTFDLRSCKRADHSGDYRKGDRRCRALIRTRLLDVSSALPRQRVDKPETRPAWARVLDAVPIVRHREPCLAVADPCLEFHGDAPARLPKRMFDAVCRRLVQDEPKRNGPVNRKLDFINLHLDDHVLRLLLDRRAQRAQVTGYVDCMRAFGGSELVVRTWCYQHHIGRRVAGGPWCVSRVALAMLLDGNADALAAYHAGDRHGPLVASYYERLGLATLLRAWRARRSELGSGLPL